MITQPPHTQTDPASNDATTNGTPYYRAPYGAPYSGDPSAASQGILGSLDPARLLRVMRRKWLTILLVLIFAGLAAFYYLTTTKKVYRATGLIELSVRRPRIMAQQAAVIEDTAGSQSEEIFNTRIEKLKGREVREDAVARYRKQYPEARNDDVLSKGSSPSCTLLRKTRLVKIEFSHTDPKFAADFCTAFTEAAEASVYGENRLDSDAAVTWLEGQSLTLRAAVEKADDTLLKYRQENKFDVLESQRKTVDEALSDFNKVLVDLESQEAKERELLNSLLAVEPKPESVGKLPSSTPNAAEIKASMDKWLAAVAARDAMLSKFTVKHPEVLAQDAIVSMLLSQVLSNIDRAKTISISNLKLLGKQAESLHRKKADQAKLGSDLELMIVERQTQLTSLERTRNACDAAYRGILVRIQEAKLAADENTATIKIIERPSVPENPIKPKPPRIIALAILLGLMGGVGLALIQDSSDDQLVSPHELEATGKIRVLAVIPRSKAKDRATVATASAALEQNEVSESFAGLRAMLDSPRYKTHNGVILVSSSVPGEGKTITACNMALTYARHGEKTLLIDFDLRRPRLAGIFPQPANQLSLSAFLADGAPECSFQQLAYAVQGAPGLSVMAGRAAPHSHPELVNENKLAALLHWARTNYDRVIMDAPPLGLVSDALSLATISDVVLVVARSEVSRKQAVWHTIYRFREAGVNMLAAIVNDLDYSKSRYGYWLGYDPYRHSKAYGGKPEKDDSAT